MAAKVLFSVLVLCSLQHVFGRTCDLENIMDSCNECIRCGGIWCTDPNEEIRCSRDSDAWCTSHRVQELQIHSELEGAFFKFKHFERSVKVGTTERIELQYSSQHGNCSQIDFSFVKSSIPDEFSGNFVNETRTKYVDGECIYYIDAKPTTDFCPPYGISDEYITFKVKIDGVDEEVTVRYHVQCACNCSKDVEKMSPYCSERGDLACGACSCHNGWGGNTCTEKKTTGNCDRGDVPRCTKGNADKICSGNGVCGSCACECFYEREGSHYFDYYCDDICSVASECDSCLHDLKPSGLCDNCLYIEPFNKSLMADTFIANRNVWIECTETTDHCAIKYAARRDSKGYIHVMISDACSPIAAAQAGGGIKIIIPAVLGVLALVAVAATAGFLVWKHRTPPMALTNSNYDHIDAEECTGENPLYKPPTSSFKNPTYGKW